MASRLLGVDRRRTLPVFARSLAARVDGGVARRPSQLPTGEPAVVLFGDCFTMFSEPGIGLAAVRLLRAFGYAVGLADAGCCGRSKISLGLLGEASRAIPRTAERLIGWVRDPRVRAVLVLEPSCQSAICDDWLDLRSAAPAGDVQAIVAKTMSVEAFLERGWEEHPRRPVWPATGDAVYHGHCHAKALVGVDSETAILRRAAGDRVEMLDTGCCGMAGAFGYAAHRYDLSMKIGEQVLMPAVRGREEGAAVLAPGTSCRHQIADATGVRAVHPVEWLAGLVVGEGLGSGGGVAGGVEVAKEG
jgi:Fe-S oxidoreductase